eukprot:TRINITY_DN2389_c0_g1_i1.p2 TRINITY_DN2389_c0_g1~~TRINITY_DN2389_c0_g1_i1.p2  ORF type:complete len:1145 (-),score=464.89 TRINITY_DN2389_c0_g1_i1:191-3625(-)
MSSSCSSSVGSPPSSTSVDAQLVTLLNEASLESSVPLKLEKLSAAQELLVRKAPHLLDNFLDEVMGFQSDRSSDVRRFVVGFIEEACKVDPELLAKVIKNVQILMMDSPVPVQKRVIQAMSHLYKIALRWICRAKSLTEDMEAVWGEISDLKIIILMLLDSDNDGIRTHTVKFMEMLVISQTREEPGSALPHKSSPDAFHLGHVPLNLQIARPRKLEEEAGEVLEKMIAYHGSSHISSANLMTCMSGLTNIAKQRPSFLPRVMTALEMLQANLPPTLAKSQVSSVRKHLKNQLLSLLKHPMASDKYLTNITTLLTDLGASREEVSRALPKPEELKRRAHKHKMEAKAAALAAADKERKLLLEPPSSKRGKVVEEAGSEDEEDDEEEEEGIPSASKDPLCASAVDITEKFILERLDPFMASEIVLRSMSRLPRDIPPQFHNTYTPIASAGTDGQIQHVARLLATQFTAKNLGPGVEAERKNRKKRRLEERHEQEEEEEEARKKSNNKPEKISTLIGGQETSSGGSLSSASASKPVPKVAKMLTPSGMSKKSSRTLKLSEITAPLKTREKEGLLRCALHRVLKTERLAAMGGAGKERVKILTTLVASGGIQLKDILLEYILGDLQAHAEVAFSWLYEEYCLNKRFNRGLLSSRRKDDEHNNYNYVLCSLLKGILLHSSPPKDRESILRRVYCESPLLPDDAIQLLRQVVRIDTIAGVDLLKDLVTLRPSKKLNFLNLLLELTSHDNLLLRESASKSVLELHERADLRIFIEEYSIMYLQFLSSPGPPSMIFSEEQGRPTPPANVWDEHLIKVTLHLFLALLSRNIKMFSYLAAVYVETSGDVKRTLFRLLDAPLRNVPMDDPDLLELIGDCPPGSETLVMRIVRILTEKTPPTTLLVDKVRNLYNSRVSDVRFLIPILTGLSKNEVLAALPKLIALTQIVVKEVFSRLLSTPNSPLSPSDLLIALHTIEADMKDLMKATALCFAERSVYTQEVLVIVIQQLLELPTIPLLLMRTVIHSLTAYPKLLGFVMNVLQKLIVKQVWRQKTLWDGFIKACVRTVPQSYTVLLQLPPPNLQDFLLKGSPNMREPLLEHVQSFNESQRAHVSPAIMEVLYKEDLESVVAATAANIKTEIPEEPLASEPAPPGE